MEQEVFPVLRLLLRSLVHNKAEDYPATLTPEDEVITATTRPSSIQLIYKGINIHQAAICSLLNIPTIIAIQL